MEVEVTGPDPTGIQITFQAREARAAVPTAREVHRRRSLQTNDADLRLAVSQCRGYGEGSRGHGEAVPERLSVASWVRRQRGYRYGGQRPLAARETCPSDHLADGVGAPTDGAFDLWFVVVKHGLGRQGVVAASPPLARANLQAP